MSTEIVTHLKQCVELAKQVHPMAFAVERFVLEHGREFPAGKRPKGFRRGTRRHCFKNATHRTMFGPWTYVEGFAINPAIHNFPIHHAWVIDEAGAAIETTWPEQGGKYFGVAIPTQDLMDEIVRLEHYGILWARRGPNGEFMRRFSEGKLAHAA